MPVRRKGGLISRILDSAADVNRVIFLLWLMVVLGLLSLLVPASVKLIQHDTAGALLVVASGLFMAGGATVSGSAIGFLFGVPRRRVVASEIERSGNSTDRSGYRPNTNLEQISDWLTKIIVGVGLVQLPAILESIGRLGDFAGPAFASSPTGEIVAISLVVHYVLVGFFQGFLLAYLWLPGAFARATERMQVGTDSREREVVVTSTDSETSDEQGS